MSGRRQGCGVIAIAAVISMVLGLGGGGLGAWLYLRSLPQETAGQTQQARTTKIEVLTDEDAIVKAVERVDPAVVKIVATTVVQPSNPFDFFFGGGSRVERGVGSGVIFDYEGRKLVLTNTHVVGDAQQITVQMRNGDSYQGKVLAYDRASDVAVVEIETDQADLPTAPLGNSDDLRIGEWVVAIGHPYAFFDHTVTVGVVSAQGPRQVGGPGNSYTRNVIQTDAAINQGNSGGPLVDLGGNVVGINSMIFSPTGSTVGIGFAIPISEAKQVVHFLIHGGPWIGIQAAIPNSTGLARYLQLQTTEGVVIVQVAQDSPAAKAGLAQYDVVLAVDGNKVTSSEDLRNTIFAHEIGDTITLTVQRGAESKDLSVTAGKVPRGMYQ